MDKDALIASLNRLFIPALVIGVIGIAICAASFSVVGEKQFFQSYLMGWIFWFQVSVGCMVALLVHHLAGGRWGGVIQRVLESGIMLFPVLGLLFLPILLGTALGVTSIYDWAIPSIVEHDPLLQYKQWYLNIPFWATRAVVFFSLWSVMAWLLNKYSIELDKTGDIAVKNRMKNISGPGLLLFGLTVTYASFDWLMSLEPHWFSTMYGFTFGVGAGNGAIAFLILFVAFFLIKYEPFSKVIRPLQINDYANFLFGAVMTWGYAALCQGLIIWSGDLSEFSAWYVRRTTHGWETIFFILVIIQFAIPFFFLLFWPIKRNLQLISLMAVIVLVARVLDIYFLVAPAAVFGHDSPYFDWAYLAAIVGVGGIWLAVFTKTLASKPSLIPLKDPKTMFQKELQHGTRHAATHSH